MPHPTRSGEEMGVKENSGEKKREEERGNI
jgi:hypothetical protein